MKNIILFDPEEARARLLPLTLTRPVALIRHGITTIAEKWQKAIPGDYSFSTEDYLSMKYPMQETADGDNLFIAGNLHPDSHLVEAILALQPGQELRHQGVTLARRGNGEPAQSVDYETTPFAINHVWDIFMLMTRPSAAISPP